jgi:3-deoxy-manno-octulosonate cytidylyltransferase (CMP-KDO synthetase)
MLLGKPLIQHVYERVQGASGIDQVLVATDDERIRTAVEKFGGRAILTKEPYRTGTDRVAGVARQLPGDIFLNLQGDEIALTVELFGDLIRPFCAGRAGMGTLKRRLTAEADVQNPGVVKVVTDHEGRALYFSRAPVPHVRDAREQVAAGLHHVHLGIYIYRRETLLRFAGLPTGVLEEAEKLEQLRALEHGLPIQVWETAHPSLRIDTAEDLAEAADVLSKLEPCPSNS